MFSKVAFDLPLFSCRERPGMPSLCPGFGADVNMVGERQLFPLRSAEPEVNRHTYAGTLVRCMRVHMIAQRQFAISQYVPPLLTVQMFAPPTLDLPNASDWLIYLAYAKIGGISISLRPSLLPFSRMSKAAVSMPGTSWRAISMSWPSRATKGSQSKQPMMGCSP